MQSFPLLLTPQGSVNGLGGGGGVGGGRATGMSLLHWRSSAQGVSLLLVYWDFVCYDPTLRASLPGTFLQMVSYKNKRLYNLSCL